MNSIQNIHGYINSMSTTLPDKCWWLDKIPDTIDTIVDYGCAQGDLGVYINEVCPNRFKYIGIDNSPEMIMLAFSNHRSYLFGRDSKFYPDIFDIEDKCDTSRAILVLNSVIHEILTYLPEEQNVPLFRKIFNSGFCAIAIRDMYMPNLTNNFWRNINAVRSSQYRHMWQEYNNYWHGKMEQRCKGLWCNEQDIALVEFLMKYRYRDNWEREMREAYFWRWYVNILPAYIDNYGIVYDRGFSIPFICDRVMHDFGIRIDGMHTHRKMLFAHL